MDKNRLSKSIANEFKGFKNCRWLPSTTKTAFIKSGCFEGPPIGDVSNKGDHLNLKSLDSLFREDCLFVESLSHFLTVFSICGLTASIVELGGPKLLGMFAPRAIANACGF